MKGRITKWTELHRSAEAEAHVETQCRLSLSVRCPHELRQRTRDVGLKARVEAALAAVNHAVQVDNVSHVSGLESSSDGKPFWRSVSRVHNPILRFRI